MLKLRAFALLTVATLGLAACAGAAAPPSSTQGAIATPKPTPTAVPGDPGNGGNTGGGSGIGGTDPGSGTGGGIVIPVPGGPHDNPLFGNATYVKPTLGLVNQRTVNVQLLRAVVNADGTVTADLRWWSGVAPGSWSISVEGDAPQIPLDVP